MGGLHSIDLTEPLQPERLGTRLARSAEAGLVQGVRYAVMLFVIALALMLFVGDYQVTRARAEHGEQAYGYILRSQQQAAAAKTPEANAPQK